MIDIEKPIAIFNPDTGERISRAVAWEAIDGHITVCVDGDATLVANIESGQVWNRNGDAMKYRLAE